MTHALTSWLNDARAFEIYSSVSIAGRFSSMNLACVTACSTWWTSPVLAGLLQEILLYKLPAWEFRVPWALQSASPANKIKQGSLSSTCFNVFNNIVTQSSAIRIWTVCLFSFLVEQEAWLAGLRKSFFELAERNQGNQGEWDRIFQLSECHGLSLWHSLREYATSCNIRSSQMSFYPSMASGKQVLSAWVIVHRSSLQKKRFQL